MDERTPDTPEEPTPPSDVPPETRGAEMADDTPVRAVTPDPHAAEPVPPAQEGMRLGADDTVVRPETDEPNGPVEGLLHAAATEVAAEAPGEARAAEMEAIHLGIEDEGVEAAQIMGLMIATAVSVVALVLFIVFLFYLPARDATVVAVENVPEDRYVELNETRVEGLSLLTDYAVSPEGEGRYRIPIEAAMAQVAAADSVEASPYVTPIDFNLSWIDLLPASSVYQSASEQDADRLLFPASPSEIAEGDAPVVLDAAEADDVGPLGEFEGADGPADDDVLDEE